MSKKIDTSTLRIEPINLATDLSAILKIENESFEFPYDRLDFSSMLNTSPFFSGLVVKKKDNTIIAFAILEYFFEDYELKDIAVSENYRRQGVATFLLDKIKEKLDPESRPELVLLVRETNEKAQLFFKNQGFLAIPVLKNPYKETPDDAYVMVYSVAIDAQLLTQEQQQKVLQRYTDRLNHENAFHQYDEMPRRIMADDINVDVIAIVDANKGYTKYQFEVDDNNKIKATLSSDLDTVLAAVTKALKSQKDSRPLAILATIAATLRDIKTPQ